MTHLQIPVASPFGASSTATDVLQGMDLGGKTIIVTGGYAGIGREAVRTLLAANAKVVVPARNLDKARRNLVDLPDAILVEMDLMDPESIDAFAEGFLADHDRLDILINCAGVMANPLSRDARGYESQFSTNVLGHFQLTARLWPALAAAEGARVVALSSANHRVNIGDVLHDPNFQTTAYDPWKAYAQSKAANILFAVALDSIGKHSGVRAFAVHPGGIFETDLVRHMDLAIARAYGMIDDDGKAIIDPEKGWKTPQQGASTMLFAATSRLLKDRGGVYLADNNIALPAADDGDTALTNSVAPNVTDAVAAGRLWQLCEQLTGARLD